MPRRLGSPSTALDIGVEYGYSACMKKWPSGRFRLALLVIACSVPMSAGAQVLITEIQPNPTTSADLDEWIEIENTTNASVSVGLWSLNDYTGTSSVTESAARWTFPSTAAIAANEVIVVARQARAFFVANGRNPTWELADGNDDPGVPNLRRLGGAGMIQLSNATTGDAVVLRDNSAQARSAVEWGTVDRRVSGTPLTQVPAAGDSLTRIATSGSSASDFRVTTTPGPFVGYRAGGPPSIASVRSEPRHVSVDDTFTVTASVSDPDGLRLVEILLTTATSSTATAAHDYVAVGMTVSGTVATFSAPVANLAAGLGMDPQTFHEQYVRYFIRAEDNFGAAGTSPRRAQESRGNTAYLPRFAQNVMPRTPTRILDARESLAGSDAPRWAGHSVRVEGVALIGPRIMNPTATQFTVQDASGKAIAFFNSQRPSVRFAAGDRVRVTGALAHFQGLTQISGTSTVTVLSGTEAEPETTLTISALLSSKENYESQLIAIEDADFTTPRTTWPNDTANQNSWNVSITDGTGEIIVRVTSTCPLFGDPAPQYGFAIRGVLIQRGTVWTLFPRGPGDVAAKPAPPTPDAGVNPDATALADGGISPRQDASMSDIQTNGNDKSGGCGCHAASATRAEFGRTLFVLGLLATVLLRRRRLA